MVAALALLATVVAGKVCPPGTGTADIPLWKESTVNSIIGTPGAALFLVVDTKAEFTWLTDQYVPAKSSTFQPLDGTFEGYYWGLTITGTRGRDVIRFGNNEYTTDLGLTTLSPPEVGNVNGVLALGGSATSFFGQASPKWPKKIMGMHLPINNKKAGVLNLGYTNPAEYTGELSWIPVISGDGWRASFGGISVTGNRTASHPGRNFAVWDSSEDTSAAPRDVVTAIYGKDPRINKITAVWSMPCDVIEGATVRIRLGGRQFSISRAALLRRDHTAPGQCIGNFAVAEDDNVHLGRSFMRTWYTAFSAEGVRRVGLARPVFPLGFTINSMSINDG
ncbi:hypothetical protein CspHIS471_0301810 [Cutaneotrichosporon sp. HIS471]|nr:hypothetical protein CspHIS471_0301810 [Cutaneotrichosporon sp. HIS471]